MNMKRIAIFGLGFGLLAGLLATCTGMIPCCLSSFGVPIFAALAGLLGGGVAVYLDPFTDVAEDERTAAGAKQGAIYGGAAALTGAVLGFFGDLIAGFIVDVVWMAIQLGDFSYIFDMIGPFMIGFLTSAVTGFFLAVVGLVLGLILGVAGGAVAAMMK